MNIVIRNAAITLNGNDILTYINFDINEKSKIGIVGENGAGKTTLLRAIIDNELFSEGIGTEKFQIIKNGLFKIGYLSQISINDNKKLIDVILESFSEIIEIERKLQKIESGLLTNDVEKYDELLNKYKNLGGYTYKKEYELMLTKFGFVEGDKEKYVRDFSGGEKTKIAFIKLLLSKPDLLILDEPTNNLDMETVEWLEEYLSKYKKALIVVSHDRMFLNRIVDTIYDIDYGEVIKYVGNYDYFEKQKKLNYEKLKKEYEFQQKEIKRLTEIYERFRNKPSKSSMALSKLKQIEKMNIIEEPNNINKSTLKINYNDFVASSKKILRMNDLEVGYEKPLFKVNFEVEKGDKIAIIGRNGCGKSTIMKTITGKLTPISGEISYGLHVNPGYFDQTLGFSDENLSIIDEFKKNHPSLLEQEVRSYLALFLFRGEDVFKKVNVLSGGEKARLKLSIIFAYKPNLLILDEVTNHIDMKTKEYLEQILVDYQGTIIFISHDRYFVKKLATKLIIITNNNVTCFDGSYDKYLEKNTKIESASENNTFASKILEPKNKQKNNDKEVRKEINKLENEIAKLELKIDELKQSTFVEENYSDFNKMQTIMKKIEDLNLELTEKMKHWEELFSIIDK